MLNQIKFCPKKQMKKVVKGAKEEEKQKELVKKGRTTDNRIQKYF